MGELEFSVISPPLFIEISPLVPPSGFYFKEMNMLNEDQKQILLYLRRSSKGDSIKRDAADLIESLVGLCEALTVAKPAETNSNPLTHENAVLSELCEIYRAKIAILEDKLLDTKSSPLQQSSTFQGFGKGHPNLEVLNYYSRGDLRENQYINFPGSFNQNIG